MSRNNLLRTLGLFIKPGFLAPEQCFRLGQHMLAGPAVPARVYLGEGDATGVDAVRRRSLSVDVHGVESASVERTFDELIGELSAHFNVRLSAHEPPHYLVYGPGAFFRAHRDRPTAIGAALEAAARKVSAVVF